MSQGTSYSDLCLSNLVGSAMETVTSVDHIDVRTLLDTGSMITCISASFVKNNFSSLPKYPIGHILCVKGPLDEKLPYTDFVELEISIPVDGKRHIVGLYPVLIAPDNDYNRKVPLLVGSNVLDRLDEQVCGAKSNSQISFDRFDRPVAVALQTIALRKRHLEKSNGVYGLVRSSGSISVEPFQTVLVKCNMQVAIPVVRSVAMVQSRQCDQISHILEVTPCVVPLDEQARELEIQLSNPGKTRIHLDPNSILAEIHQVHLEPVISNGTEHGFLSQFHLEKLSDSGSPEILDKLSLLLLEEQVGFASSKLDIGHTPVVQHEIELTDNTPFK